MGLSPADYIGGLGCAGAAQLSDGTLERSSASQHVTALPKSECPVWFEFCQAKKACHHDVMVRRVSATGSGRRTQSMLQ